MYTIHKCPDCSSMVLEHKAAQRNEEDFISCPVCYRNDQIGTVAPYMDRAVITSDAYNVEQTIRNLETYMIGNVRWV